MAGDAESFRWFGSAQGIVTGTVIMIVCLVMCFLFSMLGYSVSAAGHLKHTKENEEKITKAIKIKNQTEKYAHNARTGFSFYFAVMIIAACFAYISPVYQFFSKIGIADMFSMILAFLIVLILSAVLSVTVGQLVPQKLASEDPEKILTRYAGIFTGISVIISPFTMICSCLTNIIVRMLGHHTNQNEKIKTEEKILMMVDQGEETGMIEENTKSMIENVFDFDDTTVGEIMTHRKDVVAVEDDTEINALTKLVIESGRSRIPVYHDDIDNIIGIIYAKDLLKFIGTDSPVHTIGKDMIREAVFVPESKRCSEMFEYMTKRKIQIAIVVDEFGGTGGIITMEDLIESILGNIQDEYDNEEEEIKKVNEYSFKVDGATSLDEISDLTGIDFEDEEDDTIAGVMLNRMGHIPKNGEHPSIMINGTRFTVLEVENRRISQILVVKKNKSEPL